MSLVHNEQIKLTAASLDRISTACIAIGVIAPIAATTFGAPGYSGGLVLVGFSMAWLFVGACLHFIARAFLRRLRP